MKKAVTLRLDPELLDDVRRWSRLDNRTFTNFVETALMERVAAMSGRRRSAAIRPASHARARDSVPARAGHGR